jgi:hypothetical protein
VNTIYDNAVQGLRRHEILQWVLQTDSQQWACPPYLLPPSLGTWIPMELGSAGHSLLLASDLPAITKWPPSGTWDLPFVGLLCSLVRDPWWNKEKWEVGKNSYLHA